MPKRALKPQPIRLGVYRHYSGKEYDVLGVARHSETQIEFVVYRMRYGKRFMWIRPRKMFESLVKLNGKRVKRFTFIHRAN